MNSRNANRSAGVRRSNWSADLRSGAPGCLDPRRVGDRRSNAPAGLRGAFVSVLGWIVLACGVVAAPLPADWQHEQSFTVSSPGLIKMSLPADTLDAGRATLEDLRLFTEAGAEVPYLIERPRPASRVVVNAKTFQVALNPRATVITLQSGLTQAIDGVTLETPAADFIKSVKVEASPDGNRWQTLTDGAPVFRQRGGVQQLLVPLPPAVSPWVRLTVDDQRSNPIPFTGARVQAASAETAPDLPLAVTIAERHENPDETRLTLQLGASHVVLTELEVATDEPLFSRKVDFAAARVSEGAIVEQTLASGVIYRIAIEGRPAVSNLTVSAEVQAPSRELLLRIRNGDSPPLPITSVTARRRPVYLVFLAHQAGVYHLLTGNPRCGAPNYDLAALGSDLKSAPLTSVTVSGLADNPAYRAPEVLPGLEEHSTLLDVTRWRFRKPVELKRNGAQQIELDPEVLSEAQPGLQDLRLVRDGGQIPYVVERTSISRSYTPDITITNDTKDPSISRWILKLPQARVPVTRLECYAHTALFQREMTLYENVTDDRGGIERRVLGQSTWVQTPGQTNSLWRLTIDATPQSDRLYLDTHNGDNPPIVLAEFNLYYPATRILFKARTNDALFLYFGNSEAQPPRYDLSLVAAELVGADKSVAGLGNLEVLWKSTWKPGQGASAGVIFWAALGLVVVALLVIIARLLPKPTEGNEK